MIVDALAVWHEKERGFVVSELFRLFEQDGFICAIYAVGKSLEAAQPLLLAERFEIGLNVVNFFDVFDYDPKHIFILLEV